VKLVGNVPVNGFIHRSFPINFRIQVDEVDAQRGSDKQHVIIPDMERTAFDFGDCAAGGVMPARELQFDSKVLLRPAVALAQFADLLSNQVLHIRSNRFTANSSSASAEITQLFVPAFAAIFHVYSKTRDEVCAMGYTTFLAEWPASPPVKDDLARFMPRFYQKFVVEKFIG
jgi:hypothetical protein